MNAYTDDLATAVVWNLALKCHAVGRRHRHQISDQLADQLLLHLELKLRQKGLTYHILGVAKDERDYRRSLKRVFPPGRNGEHCEPIPIGRGRNPRGHPLNSSVLRKLYEAAIREGVMSEQLGGEAIQQLDIAKKGFEMVNFIMTKINRGSLPGRGEQVLFGWRGSDSPRCPLIYEIDRESSSGFGERMLDFGPAELILFGGQAVKPLRPAIMALPGKRLEAWVFSDAHFRSDRFEVFVSIRVFTQSVVPESTVDRSSAG